VSRITAIDHVQLAMPAGREDEARRFYGHLLGMEELVKPPVLAARGGVWFATGAVQVHLGVEKDFRPAQKAHPAFRTDDLPALAERLRTAGYQVNPDNDLPGVARFYVPDCFGNRLEFVGV
jgi:catechol 2,3-dioxygenase-like lactoylglutathione lyase family enzyme